MTELIKSSTVDDVLEEMVRTAADVQFSAEYIANEQFASRVEAILADVELNPVKRQRLLGGIKREQEAYSKLVTAELLTVIPTFFSPYDITVPQLSRVSRAPRQVEKGLDVILLEHGQEALEAVKGVTKLVGKVIFYARDNGKDTRSYVGGVLKVLSGLPLGQLYANPEKNSVMLENWTVRDMISELISNGKDGEPLMLEMLADTAELEGVPYEERLPAIAARVKELGPEEYARFLHQSLSPLINRYLASADMVPGIDVALTGIAALAESLKPVEEANGHAGDVYYRVSAFEQFVRTGPKVIAAKLGVIEAVYGNARDDGGNRTVGIYVSVNGTLQLHRTRYETKPMSLDVVNILMQIQQAAPAAADRNHPLNAHNVRAGSVLKHALLD